MITPVDDGHPGVERRAQNVLDQFTHLMAKHTKDEMDRYDKIIDDLEAAKTDVAAVKSDIHELTTKIEDNDAASTNRHEETQRKVKVLTESINAFMEGQGAFIAAIIRAFPKDEEGRPDYDGHKKAHLSWISNAKDEKEVMEFVRRQMKDEEKSADLLAYIKKVIFAGAAVAVCSFLAIAAWAAFLKGPV